MAVLNSVGARVYVAGADLTTYFNELTPSPNLQTQDVTTFGSGVTGRSFAATLREDSFGVAGFFDSDATNGPDAILGPLRGATQVATFWPAGDAAGRRGWGSGVATLDQERAVSRVGSVVAFSANWKASGGADPVTSLETKTDVTGTGSAVVTTAVDNGASTANGGAAYFQIFSTTATPGISSLILEHSTDNSTFVTLATATLTGAGAERIAIAAGTTIRRYVRRSLTNTSGKHVVVQTAVYRAA